MFKKKEDFEADIAKSVIAQTYGLDKQVIEDIAVYFFLYATNKEAEEQVRQEASEMIKLLKEIEESSQRLKTALDRANVNPTAKSMLIRKAAQMLCRHPNGFTDHDISAIPWKVDPEEPVDVPQLDQIQDVAHELLHRPTKYERQFLPKRGRPAATHLHLLVTRLWGIVEKELSEFNQPTHIDFIQELLTIAGIYLEDKTIEDIIHSPLSNDEIVQARVEQEYLIPLYR